MLFYDGECGLCHGFVRFVLQQDSQGKIKFAPLQGSRFAALKLAHNLKELPDSLVYYRGQNELLYKSQAVLAVLGELAGIWSLAAKLLGLVPRNIADFIYDQIAKIRKRIFGKPKQLCPIIPPELQKRFYP